MIESIVIAVVASLVVALFIGAWNRRSVIPDWFRRQITFADREDKLDKAKQVAVLREQVLEVAREIGVVLPASSTGREPTVVTMSDDEVHFYFKDHDRYLSAMRSGRVPPTLSYQARAPRPVSRWKRPQLERWLAEQADRAD